MVKKKYGEKNVEKKNRLQPNRYDTYVKILFERWKNEGRLRLSYILNLSKKIESDPQEVINAWMSLAVMARF